MRHLTYILFLLTMVVKAQETITEEYTLYNDDIVLPGTLSLPQSRSKLPLAIFVHGSGSANRDGNDGALAKANHIKQLADNLNQEGIAFYRYDKRNANTSNSNKIDMSTATIQDLVKDVQVAINQFSKDDRFSTISVIGHSQGSLVGMLSVNEKVDHYISLAGPGTTVDKSLIRQLEAKNEELGKIAASHIEELITTDTIKEVNILLLALFAPNNQKYLKNWIMLNPAEEIKKLTIPTLIINGSQDFQVTVNDAELLKKAKPNAELIIIEKMNHMLKTVENDEENRQSYFSPDFPLSSRMVQAISEFIKTNG